MSHAYAGLKYLSQLNFNFGRLNISKAMNYMGLTGEFANLSIAFDPKNMNAYHYGQL